MRWILAFTVSVLFSAAAFAQGANNPPVTFADNARSLASFGVDMTGATDTTTQFQTALRSGVPLTCTGTVRVTSLVTVTNTNVSLVGTGDGHSCVLLYTTTQSMVMITEVGNQLRTNNRVRLEHIEVIPQAAISSVGGATHTAAFDIEYPLGTNGTVSPTVSVFDVQVQPSADANYILNGLYINDADSAKIDHFYFEGQRSSFNSAISAVVYDGTHSPSSLTVTDSLADYVGIGVGLVQETTGGWQGGRIHNFDCLYCDRAISARGSLDSTSDYLVVDGNEGPVQSFGVLTTNVMHVTIHDNYFFLADMNITGGAHQTFPTCYEMDWTIAVGSNGSSSDIHNNTCDGAQVTGYTARYGLGGTGISRTNLNSHIGVNELTNLDFGMSLTSGTAGFTLEHQRLKGVTTEYQDGSTAGDNIVVPPLGTATGVAAAAGLVGEVMSLNVPFASGVSQPTSGTAINIGSLTLTPGNWMCNGMGWTQPAATTTTSQFFVSVWTSSANLGTLGALYLGLNSSAIPAATEETVSAGPAPFNVSTSTPIYLVGNATFAVSTMKLYGSMQCVRYM